MPLWIYSGSAAFLTLESNCASVGILSGLTGDSGILFEIVLNNLVKVTKFGEEYLDFYEVFNYFIRLKFTLQIAKQACL